MQTIRFREGNDLPYSLYVPAYAATAWYHKKLAEDLQARSLEQVVEEVQDWALGPYTLALMQGDRVSPEQRSEIAATLARYTGLSQTYVERRDLRIEHWRFCKELLRDEGKTVGRLDSRLTAREYDVAAEAPDFDSSHAHFGPPFVATLNDYLRRTLKYETDLPYAVFGNVGEWKWANGAFSETASALAAALARNPHLRVLFACGYYDLATPFPAAEYTAAHLGIDPTLRPNLSFTYYPAGHMMYIESGSLAKLKTDVAAFLAG
jgi:carboxypeptidase C (cathepsin A)